MDGASDGTRETANDGNRPGAGDMPRPDAAAGLTRLDILESGVFAVLGETAALTRIHLRASAEQDDTPILKPPRRDDDRRRVPDRVERYPIVGEIARGGIGAVYKARDPELGRDIAIKVLLDEHLKNPDIVKRFVEEAQICGQMQHPGIVPIHDVGLAAGEKPYFTMKLIKGRTLAALLEERRDSAEGRQRFIAIFEQLCRTVAYAHARRVIHRDLKPANIMIGAFGEVQVMDWGLAKVFTAGGGRERPWIAQRTHLSVIHTLRTETGGSDSMAGSIMGTPAYMSPEQARGELDEVDERSDVFGLGSILCEILTGKPPYAAAKIAEIFHQARKGYLDDAYARLDGCGADRELVELAKRCLAFEPRDRPPDGAAVAREVGAYLTALEGRVRASAVEAAEARARAVQVRRNRRLTLVLAATLAVALLAGVGSHLWLERQEARRAAEHARVVNESLNEARELRSLALAAPAVDLSRWEAAHEAAARAARRAEQAGDEGLLRQAAEFETSIAGDVEQARETAARALRNGRAVERLAEIRAVGEEGEERAGAAYRGVLLDLGIDVEGLAEDEAARRIQETGIAAELAQALDGWAVWSKGFHGKTSRGWKRLLRIARQADPDPWRSRLRRAVEEDDDLEVRRLAAELKPAGSSPSTLAFVAGRLGALGESVRAGALLSQAQLVFPDDYQLRLSLGDVPSAMAAFALRPGSWLAAYRLASWAWKNSNERHLAFAREAVRLKPDSAHAMNMLGIALSDREDRDGARQAYEKAIALDPYEGAPHNNLALLFDAPADREARVNLYRKALLLTPSGVIWRNLGTTLEEDGDWKGAIAAWKEAIRLGRDPATLNDEIGQALGERLGDLHGAAAHFREAARLSRNWVVPRVHLGLALLDLGRLAEALGAFAEALVIDPRDAWTYEQIFPALAMASIPACDAAFSAAARDWLATIERIRASEKELPPQAPQLRLVALNFLAATGDAERALELAAREIEGPGRRTAEALGLLARIQRSGGRHRDAILSLEEAVRLPDASSLLSVQLHEYREALLPDLVTYGSIDAALEGDALIPSGARWRYFPGRDAPAPGIDWTTPDFDDRDWKEGPSGFGYGDNDDATVLSDMQNTYSTLYARRAFRIAAPPAYRRVTLSVRIDDGFVAYVNGVEVGRHNVRGQRGDPLPHDAFAASTVANAVEAPAIAIDPGLLRAGENTIAIQAVNGTLESSDFTLIPVLRGELRGDIEPERGRFAAFRRVAGGGDAEARALYLEGRLNQRAGRVPEAERLFRQASALAVDQPEPRQRLAECLRTLGKPGEAEAILREFFEARGAAPAAGALLWLDLVLGDLGRSWEEAAALLSPKITCPGTGPASARIWAIRSYAEHGVLRINCGGEEYRARDGTLWAGDRFSGAGLTNRIAGDVRKTDDDLLYQTERYFLGQTGQATAAYRIPLPDGQYLVRLLLAETNPRHQGPGARVFDVSFEGAPVLVRYDAVAAVGWGLPDVREFTVKVADGHLDVGVTPWVGNPRLSAIEIAKLDLPAFLAATWRRVAATGRSDAAALSRLGEALELSGERAEAIAAIEEAANVADAPVAVDRALRTLREASLPDLPTLGSIDAALEGDLLRREPLVGEGTSWRYLPGASEPSQGLEWTRLDFDDRSWSEGRSGFGYGGSRAPATVLGGMKDGYTSVYFRTVFRIPDIETYDGFILSVLVDDGYIAYVNGVEVGRYHAPGPQGARADHGAVATEGIGGAVEAPIAAIDRGLFRTGENVLAIQGLNHGVDSTDFALVPRLSGMRRLTPEELAAKLDAFRAAARGHDAPARVRYLDGRLLQRAGKPREALREFEAAAAAAAPPASSASASASASAAGIGAGGAVGAADGLIDLRIAECRQALGSFAETETALRRALAGDRVVAGEVVGRWLDLEVRDMKRGIGEAIEPLAAARVPNTITVVPTSEQVGQEWSYTTTRPPEGWAAPDFDASGWKKGLGSFGAENPAGVVVRTPWTTQHIWIRRTIRLERTRLVNPFLRINHDDDAEVYVNGNEAARLREWSDGAYILAPLANLEVDPAGLVTLAAHCYQYHGIQTIDIGIVEGVADAIWAMRELREKGAIRVNCGGDEHVSAAGAVWRQDRCFVRGSPSGFTVEQRPEDVKRTTDDELYVRMRWFDRRHEGAAGYAIPVPPGRFRVALHFAEVDPQMNRAGTRVFGVRLEGKAVLEHYDIVREVGFAAADVRSYTVDVPDGRVDIGFLYETREPMLSAIEITRAE